MRHGSLQLVTSGQNDGAFDQVLQLANVARPRISHQRLHRRRRHARDRPVHAPGTLVGEIRDQQRNVLGPVTQRRDLDREDVEPVEQIRAKPLRVDHFLKIDVRRGHQARVGAERARVAEPFEFTLLQHTEQLGLQFERRLADFVQEYRPAMGQLEPTDPLRDRAGKRALFVAKQLAFEQAGGNGGAVALHEGMPASRTHAMESASDQFLPRARLPTDEHGRIGGGHRFELRHHVPERPAPSNHPFAHHVVGNERAEAHGTLRECGSLEPRADQGC